MDALPLPSGGSAITFETPTIVKHAIGGAYRSGIPSLDRSAILADLGSSVPELSFQYFADHILPPSHVDASSVKKLIAEKHIIGGRWSAFPFNPATIIGTEQAVFKRLENVVQAIVSCCDGGQRAGFQYVDNPDRVPYLERTNLTRPDAYFELDPIASTVRSGSSSESRLSAWYNIGVAGECKTANTDNNSLDDDVTAKVIWSMHHIMRSDPCRRFTLGFTIEDTTTRIWFCCRQIVLVTQPFNFITEHEKLIQFVSSVLYSGRVSMGWDPTIIRHVTDNRTYFDITVHSQGKAMQFRSSKFLSNLGAGAIRGRGTRVFRARRLNDEGKEVGEEVALRDVWVDVDRLREADIYQRLQTDVEALGPDSLKEFQRLFLTIVTHGDVLIDNVADRTLDLAMRNAEVSGSHVGKFHLWCKPLALSRPDVNSSGASPTLDAPNLTRAPVSHSRHVHPQVHYRVVFQEVGVAVFEVKSLDKFFHVLVDGAKALDLMHACGWVHRDISSGNILQVGDGGKLCDLEYAKKIDGEGGHAGTLDFMSVEVEFMDYMFKSYLPANHVSLVDDLEDIFSPASPRPPQPPPEPRCSFSHNPLHDTESLWWVAISSLYLNGTGAETSVEEVDHRIRRANEIFPRVLGSRSRYQFFLAGLESDITTTLPPVFQAPAKALDRMGLRLKHLDSKAELPLPGGPIDNTVFPEGVVGLQKCFVKIKDHSVGIPLVWLGDVLRQLSPGRSGQERGNTGLRSVDEKESES